MKKDIIKSISRIHGYYGIYRGFLVKSPFWSADQKEAFLFSSLRRTLLEASRNVPYYKALFREINFDPNTDFRCLDDIAKVPTLTKSLIFKRAGSLIDKRYLYSSVDSYTSGTTGEPMRMLLHENHLAFDAACVFRHWSQSGYGFRGKVVALRSYVPESSSAPLWKYSRLQNTLYMSAYHLTSKNAREYLKAILEFRPTILRGYPSSMNVLAEYAFSVRDDFRFLKGIYTSSETLLPQERENIVRTFGNKLFDWYGMTEPATVITECEVHNGLHINWEYGFTELLPMEGLGPNERQLVTTSLHNPVMPFIRYETGDIVTLFDESRRCCCGRNQPLVKSISGRKDECIVTPDGRRLPSVNFYTVFRKYTEILRFQIIQYGQRDVLVKLQMRRGVSLEGARKKALKQELLVRFGDEIRCEVEVTDRFVTNSDGKTPPIVRKPGTKSVEEKDEYTVSSQTAWGLQKQGIEVFKLDWNESDELPCPRVQVELKKSFENPNYIYWYPEANSSDTIQLLAAYSSVPPSSMMLSHGSDAAMETLLTALIANGDKVLLITPTYDHFRAMAEHRGAKTYGFEYFGLEDFPIEKFTEEIQSVLPRVVYLGSPNNPIGYTLSLPIIEKIISVCSSLSIIIVIDEAYYEFCGRSASRYIFSYANVIILRSFSKAFGLAGLRLGYVIASEPLIKSLLKVHNPKSVTMMAKKAVEISLMDIASVREHISAIQQGREKIRQLLETHQVFVYPSEANFLLVRHPKCAALHDYLTSHHVMVRDRTKFFAGEPHLRLTVGGPKSVRKLADLLEEYFST